MAFGASLAKQVRDRPERHVPADRQVVDERQGQHRVGVRPGGQRRSFAARPAETGARVGEVDDERQDVGRGPSRQRPVGPLGGGRVDVEGEHPAPSSAAIRLYVPVFAPRSQTAWLPASRR